MPYTILQKETTISADDFDNNWKHIAQGHMLPLGGSSLEATTGVYDLGSDSYKWNNVHVQNIEITGELQKCMNLIAETTLTVTASSIEITGLNGETDEIYEIICNIVNNTNSYFYLWINQDSNTSNYGIQRIQARNISITALRTTSSPGFYLGYYKIYNKIDFLLYASNDIKMSLSQISWGITNTNIYSIRMHGEVWNNSATLTSMKFTGYFDVGTNIQLWSKR